MTLDRWLRTPWVPAAALATVVGIDRALDARNWSTIPMGVLDDSAHAATSGILLAAFLPRRASRLAPWALAGSVLIDLDHIPLFAWGALSTGPGGRPVTHSLPTVAALSVAGAIAPGLRKPLLGLALGVGLHLVRDIATGPGLPLRWPAATTAARLPYLAYLGPLAAVAGAATVRHRRGGRRTTGRLEQG